MDPKYNAILNTPWPPTPDPDPISMSSRAAQFAPFSALSGYDSVIRETERLTQEPVFLTEESVQCLNRVLQCLQRDIAAQPAVRLTVYRADERKAGGSFQTLEGRVKRLDTTEGCLIFTDGQRVPFSSIVEIETGEAEDHP